MENDRPEVPLDDLHAAAGGHAEAAAAVSAFHAEYASDDPDPKRLQAQAKQLSGFASLAGPLERWWLDPRVQAFIAELNATGL